MTKVQDKIRELLNAQNKLHDLRMDAEAMKKQHAMLEKQNYDLIENVNETIHNIGNSPVSFYLRDYVEDIAKQWNISIDNLHVSVLTNVNYDDRFTDTEEILDQIRLDKANGIKHKINIVVSDKSTDWSKYTSVFAELNLDSIQRDCLPLSEHFFLDRRSNNGEPYATLGVFDYRDLRFDISLKDYFSMPNIISINAIENAHEKYVDPCYILDTDPTM